MRFPLSWIREFVDIKEDISQIGKAFTFSGAEVEEIIQDGSETIFDFNFTVNRPDLMSVFGIAREASALFNLKKPTYKAEAKSSKLKIGDYVSVEVVDKDLCPRYRALLIKNLNVTESPDYIKKRLTLCGLRPINGVVDITNYVLLEYGHPLHAFDLKKIKGSKVVVRRAKNGEKINLLDGSQKQLKEGMLTISDAEKPLAVAGVMGGEDSGVTFFTKDVLLEGAVFHPPSIRKTSKELNIHTDASHRFERGSDFNAPEVALLRCAQLIVDVCGGELCEDFIDIKEDICDIYIDFRYSRLKKILGIDIPLFRAISILENLNFEVTKKDDDLFSVKVPSFRVDVTREIDLIEEIIRVYGLDKLEIALPQIVDKESGRNEKQEMEKRIKRYFADRGLFETIHFSMTQPYLNKLFCGDKEEVAIVNPLSDKNCVLRKSLIPNILQTAIKNISYGRKSFGFFEIGNVYFKDSSKVIEEQRVAILLYFEEGQKSLFYKEPYDIFFLKGIFEELFSSLKRNYSFIEYEPQLPIYSKEHFLKILIDESEVGFLAYLDNFELQLQEVKGRFAVAEIVLEPLFKKVDTKFTDFSRMPVVKRDIAIVVYDKVKWENVKRVIEESKAKDLSTFELIEIYSDEKEFQDKKSLTISLYFQSKEKTLLEIEIDEQVQIILNNLKEKCVGFVRQR